MNNGLVTHDIGERIQYYRIGILSFVLGFCGLVAQTLILRGFQVVFYGNEISYAMILASWLFWVGAGSLLTSCLIARIKKIQELSILGFALFALSIPSSIFGLRYIRPILDIPVGQVMGFGPMAAAAFVLTAPVAFGVGMLFVALCRLDAQPKDKVYRPGYVYLWESLGSGVGGVAFSFLLLHVFRTTVIAWLASILIMAVLFVFFRRLKRWNVLIIALFAFLLTFLGIDGVSRLEQASQEKQWPGVNVIAVKDTPYANITVTEQSGQVSFYQNGLLSFTAGDRLTAEENVHFALLAHPNPRRVLLIGNGIGGEIQEILKYPQVTLDYVELDAGFLNLARSVFSTPLSGLLENSRLRLQVMDARRFVNITRQYYDVVLINVGDPQTAGLNRFYTLEFFADVDRILAVGGIASWRVSSSANYLSTENRLFLRSIDSTLREVFTDVRSIPGDTHTFLVSNLTDRILLSPRWFSQRLTGAGVQTQFVTSYAMPLLLDQRRIAEVEQLLAQEKGFINRDLFPQVYLFQMILWSTHFGQGFSRLMTRISVPFVVVLTVGVLVVLGLGFWKRRQGPLASVDLAVGVSGFSEILFELIVILIFQALYGIAYERIGLILGSFMLGLVVGTRLILRRAAEGKPVLLGILKRVQAWMVVYPLVLPLLFFIFREARFAQEWMAVFSVAFACVPFAAGMLGGMQYPLAALLRQEHGASDEAPGAGRLYAFDVFGASVGALLAGTVLIPLYGIIATCLCCAALNAVVLIFLWKEKTSAA